MGLWPCKQSHYITGIVPHLMCNELPVVAPPSFAPQDAKLLDKLLECRHDTSTLAVLDGVSVDSLSCS